MKVETDKENICVNKLVEQKVENIMIEGDIIVPDIKPDIVSSINTSGNVCIYKKEILDGKVRIDGSIDTYIIYLSDTEDGNVRSLNTSLDFTQMIDLSSSKANMDLDMDINLKSIECMVLNGRKVNVKSYLEVKVKTYSNEEVSILKQIENIENIQRLNKTITLNSLVGSGTSKAYAKDTIMIENTDNLAEVLKADVNITNRDFKVSYNKILAKAEIETKIMYLTEDNRICTVQKMIPLMGFIDIPNIAEENICDVKYRLKNMIVKPNDTEEHSIYIEVEVEIASYVYENKQIDLIQDLYSPEMDLKFVQKKVNTMVGLQKTKEIYSIKQKMEAPEIGGNKIYDACINPIINSANIINEQICLEGEVSIGLLFESSNITKLDQKTIKLPFNYNMTIQGITNKNNVETILEIKQQNFIVLPDGSIDVQIDIEINAKISKNIEMNIIDDIETQECRQNNMYSVIIYFVKPGDTLWSIAKRFKSTIEDIISLNAIEDENKIYAGQQLFIPRYVAKKRVLSA